MFIEKNDMFLMSSLKEHLNENLEVFTTNYGE